MYNIHIHRIVFELCLLKEEVKKERKGTKSKFSRLVFSTLIKVSGIYEADLQCSNRIGEGCTGVFDFLFVCFVYHGAAPIPYVQAAIFEPTPSSDIVKVT